MSTELPTVCVFEEAEELCLLQQGAWNKLCLVNWLQVFLFQTVAPEQSVL